MDHRLRVGILGARGIGKVHARIFHSLGAEVHGILGTSIETTRTAAEELYSSYGFRPKLFTSIDELLRDPLDAVSICTPPHLHFEQTMIAFDKGLPVFCEKPLFWANNISVQAVHAQLGQLGAHRNRRFFMNAPSALFLDTIRDRMDAADKISSLKFRFYTNGRYKGVGIAVDLFAHGLSILYKIFGPQELAALKWKTTNTQYYCSFSYANCRVEFDFREDPGGSKLFSLEVDNHVFTRIQEGAGDTYNLYFLDSRSNEKIKAIDPFIQSIQAFIDYCKAGAPVACDQFAEAEVIMKLMADALIANNQADDA